MDISIKTRTEVKIATKRNAFDCNPCVRLVTIQPAAITLQVRGMREGTITPAFGSASLSIDAAKELRDNLNVWIKEQEQPSITVDPNRYH